MQKKIEQLLAEITSFDSKDQSEIEQFRIKMLSKKGAIPQLFAQFKDVPAQEKKAFGQRLNQLKVSAQDKVRQLSETLELKDESNKDIDISLPADSLFTGSRHPVAMVKNELIEIFGRLGFSVAEGPEIEDDWHNFSALNFPPEHPARDMQDTFFIEKDPDVLLRTHTSSVQVRMMQEKAPPIRAIFPGRVFRNEAISARSHCIFHQVEGLYIDKNVSFADLKQTLLYFARELFGTQTEIRLRPSYFPFTEPSAEMDVSCRLCGGAGCNVCKYSGWIEILGCGMVDPNVLEACNIDSRSYTGFAFGIGIERMALNLYGINDIRYLFENDTRFLQQFA